MNKFNQYLIGTLIRLKKEFILKDPEPSINNNL